MDELPVIVWGVGSDLGEWEGHGVRFSTRLLG